MTKAKTIILLIVVAAIAVVATVATKDETGKVGAKDSAFFPELIGQVNDVATIEATSTGKSVLIRKAAEAWVVEGRDGYPAEAQDVRRLLLGLAELERVERKTSKPENYEQLELGDPMKADTQSVQYRLLDTDDRALATLIVGKRRIVGGGNGRDEYFVRVPEDAQTWLVRGSIPTLRSETDWLAREIVDIDQGRVARVHVTHADGEVVRIERAATTPASFELLDIPAGRVIDVDFNVHSIGSILSAVNLNDVSRNTGELPSEGAVKFMVETFDGLRVHVDIEKVESRGVIALKAEFDASLIGNAPEPASSPKSEEDGKKSPLLGKDEVVEEVALLNQRWSGWRYQIAQFIFDTLNRDVEALTKSVEPKETAGQSSTTKE
jgi:hypothetical protein